MRIEVEAGTRGAAMTALRFTHSSCSKCPWVPALRDYPTGRCKDCDINWIWDKGAVAAKTEMQIGENGKKVADTVWVKKVTGEALNCQRCGTTQLVRTTRTGQASVTKPLFGPESSLAPIRVFRGEGN